MDSFTVTIVALALIVLAYMTLRSSHKVSTYAKRIAQLEADVKAEQLNSAYWWGEWDYQCNNVDKLSNKAERLRYSEQRANKIIEQARKWKHSYHSLAVDNSDWIDRALSAETVAHAQGEVIQGLRAGLLTERAYSAYLELINEGEREAWAILSTRHTTLQDEHAEQATRIKWLVDLGTYTDDLIATLFKDRTDFANKLKNEQRLTAELLAQILTENGVKAA